MFTIRFMRERPAPKTAPELPAIEFELTDFYDAKAAHHQLPPGVDEFGRMQPGYWEQRRRAGMATDRALTGLSLEWLIKLPPSVRPEALRDQFPRIVNGLSECWPDSDTVLTFFERLLNDKRPGRRGFPAAVQKELEVLCEFRAALTPGQAAGTEPLPRELRGDTVRGSFGDTVAPDDDD
jgi:hypothetical protein